ncbi:unnamed protein product [Linum trigynum]|uniref:Uncharacterized protein n=1 Tax=Linum trigynum TaxID=586398 RepID=A0AAV2FMK9_9ROSI
MNPRRTRLDPYFYSGIKPGCRGVPEDDHFDRQAAEITEGYRGAQGCVKGRVVSQVPRKYGGGFDTNSNHIAWYRKGD